MSDVELSERALITIPEARRYVWREEDDSSRDGILVDAINDVSDSIWDHCEREFLPTTVPTRSGDDGVGNATTTFTSATAAFVAGDAGARIRIDGAFYTIASVTNGTTVVLDRALATGTALAWDFGEARAFAVTSTGYVDLRPYDLYEMGTATLYADRSDLTADVLTADEFQLLRRPGGTFYDMRTLVPEFAELHTGFGTQITILGWWGMPVVPGAVQLACKQWVKNNSENPGSYASSAMAGYNVVPDLDTITLAPAGMPAAVRFRLERWARGYTLS